MCEQHKKDSAWCEALEMIDELCSVVGMVYLELVDAANEAAW